ncbi:hypothetical protein Fmac_023185 [Flemingia macrophylla]|uniref:non-specific serine/threonine protein kinase n=1 Tax=Flemingia macrophylla TaxID=520843 RepID=A0ABD1LKS5_9FABA
MNQNTLFFTLKPFSSPLILSYIILFHLLATNSSCSVDPKYEACPPKSCGNQSISYPFYIDGIQNPFCGYPGFGISCDPKGFPTINLSDTQYIIHQILYQNKTLRVSNLAFSNTTKGCLPRTHNLTSSNLFDVAPNQKGVILFYGCGLPASLKEHRVGCYAENESRAVVALYEEDNKNIRLVSDSCMRTSEVVATTVADENGGIQESLRKGLWLTWTASDCNQCTSTGGRCGFDLDPLVYTFRCYCADRVHAAKCDPDPGFSFLFNLFTFSIVLSS